MSDLTVGQGIRLTFHFSLSLEDGSLVDSTFEGAPATLTYGDGNLPEGFESLLVGMKAGEKSDFKVMPEKAFGQYNPSNVQRMPRNSFEENLELKHGLVMSFSDANKNELPGIIKSVYDDHVDVDFNHPLAGKILGFHVHILNLEEIDENQAG
jgi:FKBP-type peptidyl-prolyl cis-trans isomerase SlpA